MYTMPVFTLYSLFLILLLIVMVMCNVEYRVMPKYVFL
jgi:hypothetical protein